MPGLDPISNIAEAAAKIVSLFKSDPTIKAQLESQQSEAALQAQVQLTLAQLDVNKTEAASTNWFVAGWRPAVGWICGAALAYGLVLKPLVQFALTAMHRLDAATVALLPTLDTGTVMGLLVPLLGIGTMRTVEKLNNSEGNR